MYERFTDRARKVMQLANQEARRFNHEYIGTEHILLGLVQEGSGVAADVLKNLDTDLRKIRLEVEKLVMQAPAPDELSSGKMPPTPRAKKVIEYAIEEARGLSHNYVGTEHLLLGLLREQESVAAQVLMNLGLKPEDVREEVLRLLGQSPATAGGGDKRRAGTVDSKTPALDVYGCDMTELARRGELDPVAGRAREIDRLVQVLSRRAKNNPALIGEPGVGKTAIVEGLAHRIARGDVPEGLRDARIVELDFGMVIAGTDTRGQVDARVTAVINEVRHGGNVVLLVNQVHILADRQGAADAFNVLRIALFRGRVRCIIAVTPGDYRKYIEGGALERRLQPISVQRPSAAETVEILRAVRDRYETHHHVRIADEALGAAVELSGLYLPELPFPQKAITLLDDAAALERQRHATPPPDFREIDAQIEQLNREKEAAVAEQDFEKAAHLRDQADKLKKRKEDITRVWREKSKETAGAVDAETVVEALSRETGVPAEAIRRRDAPALPARPGSEPITSGPEVVIARGSGLALLPHHDKALGLFEAAIRPAMEDNGLDARTAGGVGGPGSALDRVREFVRTADVIVADVAEPDPNVAFELGLCLGLGRQPILLTRDPETLPSNLRALRFLRYGEGVAGAERLRGELAAAIREALAAARSPREET
jgi:ATP-dependent Clp protease ATP-binding subunit ClpC